MKNNFKAVKRALEKMIKKSPFRFLHYGTRTKNHFHVDGFLALSLALKQKLEAVGNGPLSNGFFNLLIS